MVPDSVKLPLSFDAAALAAEARAFGDDAWIRHFNTQYYEGDWSGIPLRTPYGRMTIVPDPAGTAPYADAPPLEACPAVRALLSQLPCETTSVRLLRLGPGARVREHEDYNIGFEFGEIRLHVGVVTGPHAEFELNGAPLRIEAGECWFVDVTRPHRVWNDGAEPRIHLVIDCVVNDALRIVVESAAAS
jgi:Aspartyl/Asparaginyl beta-hydroxylase